MINYKDKGANITRQYYATPLKLKEAVKGKRRGKWFRVVLFLHGNAPVHKSHVAMASLHKSGFETLNLLAFCPDLANSDYYLFPNMNKELRGKKFDY